MSKVTWNKEQQQAIDLRNCNILVSAGAGSGKTAVLTERITSLIKEGNSILDMVICTFTEDATLEMKNRIRERLMSEGFAEQADLVYMANISTIHSICKQIIMDNFDSVGLPPKFRILSNEAVFEEQAISNALNILFEDKDFTDFAMKFSPNDDTRIKELIMKAYNFCCNIPSYEQILKNSGDKAFVEAEYCHFKIKQLKEIIIEYENLAASSLDDKESALIASDMDLLHTIEEAMENNRLPSALASFKRMPPKAPNKDIINPTRDVAKAFVKEILNFAGVLNKEQIWLNTQNDLAQLIKGIKEYEKQYDLIKSEKSYLTFNDLERYAYEILKNNEISKEYQNRYKYIFIDEYQDTSKYQQAILERISREDNVFMVGDVKQSIYGFRNADPSMFYNLYNEYDYTGKNVKIDLFRNYRSDKKILEFVNSVFSVLLNMNEEKFYPKESHLLSDIADERATVELELVFNKEKELAEATRIVQHIENCKAEGFAYKDIAVLFRSVKSQVPNLVYKLLRERGIPVDMSSGDDELYMETRVFIDYLSIIDNYNNDIPLLSVMLSDLSDFTITDIIKIKNTDKKYVKEINTIDEDGNEVTKFEEHLKYSFYDYAKYYDRKDEIKDKLDNLFKKLNEFCSESKNMTVAELMSAVLTSTDYIKKVECKKDGKAKVSQLYQLLKCASEYETMGYYDLSGFLEYFNALKDLKKSHQVQGFVQSGDAVSIMTMHKSKGLEFPVVIIGDLNKKMYRKSEESYYVFNKDIGIGLSYIDIAKKAKLDTPLMRFIKEKNTLNSLSEEMRMLYVAMTRAKIKMYIVAGIKKDDSSTSLDITSDIHADRSLLSGNATHLQALLGAINDNSPNESFHIQKIIMDDIDKEISNSPIEEYTYEEKSCEVEQILDNLDSLPSVETLVVPRKAAATELTHNEKQEYIPYVKKGVEKSSNGAMAGTVTHSLLYQINIGETVDELIERMIDGEYFTKEQLSLIDTDMLERFISSSIYERMANSKRVYREKAFIIELDEKSNYTNEPVMVQGIIDCLIEEEDGFVLIDYKTDNILKNVENALTEKYSKQLEIYAYAVSQLTGKAVKEKIIFHLKTGKQIAI